MYIKTRQKTLHYVNINTRNCVHQPRLRNENLTDMRISVQGNLFNTISGPKGNYSKLTWTVRSTQQNHKKIPYSIRCMEKKFARIVLPVHENIP